MDEPPYGYQIHHLSSLVQNPNQQLLAMIPYITQLGVHPLYIHASMFVFTLGLSHEHFPELSCLIVLC